MRDLRSALEPTRHWACADELESDLPPIRTLGRCLDNVLEFSRSAAELSRHTESPIETMLGMALLVTLPKDAEIVPQFKWRRYRIDWMVRRGDRLVFVECDGHDYHSTSEQIASDRKRDAEMHAAGITVVRFTGSDIYQAAEKCALDVLMRINGALR